MAATASWAVWALSRLLPGDRFAALRARRLPLEPDPDVAGEWTRIEPAERRMAGWRARMEPLRGKPVVAYHESWEYLARRFGLEIVGTLEPKPGIPPSPSHLARLMDRVNELDVELILKEPYYESRNPALVARETAARVVELPNQPQPGQDYLQFVDSLIDRIASAARGAGGAR